MKLIIQIPCYNEEKTLPVTLGEVPRQVEGVDEVEILIVDDGSADRTVEVAREAGVDHVVRFTHNRGLARAFSAGLDACLALGADVIVNMDADNQYRAGCIPGLVEPILEGRADVVVGERPIEAIEHFSWLKKRLQRLGSWVVRRLSGTEVPDATSGFRAYSREAALRLNVVSEFTYTLETLIQAGQTGIAVAHVPIETNPKTRESRLFASIGGYVWRSAQTIVRIYVMYRPLRTFVCVGALPLLAGLVLVVRFFYFYLTVQGPTGHVQSLLVGGVLLLLGVLFLVLGLLADVVAANRKLLEETLYRVRRQELGAGPAGRAGGPSDGDDGD